MKIVILVRILWSAGAQKIAIHETIELKRLGYDVDLIFLRRGKTWKVYEDLLTRSGYKVISEGRNSIFTRLYSFITGLFMQDRKGEGRVDYNLLRKFPKFIAGSKPDKIICHDEWAGIAGYAAKKKLGISYEVFLHERLGGLNVFMLGNLAERYRMKILLTASRLYSVTGKISQDTYERFGIKSIPDPPGFEDLVSADIKDRVHRVVSVSMWDIGRNPFFYIDLEKVLPNYEILLLGNWRSQEYYDLFTRSLPKDTNIRIERNISEERKRLLISESMFLVRFGNMEFGLATAVIESISYGTPVIINSALGTAEMIKKYGAGYVLESADPKLVADKIVNTTEEKYKQLMENVSTLRKSWRWKDHVEKLL
jgi:glycosyltransferase involved in cell wall biosynthesis